MTTLAEHIGSWLSHRELRDNAKVVNEAGELKDALRKDIAEGKPLVLGMNVVVVFLADNPRRRYFVEVTFTANTKQELVNAFRVFEREAA